MIFNRTFTPDKITELKENQIFVFGSNLNGNHAGGAARLAVEKFGATEGQAKGLQGQSYAIPTLNKDMQKLSIEDISKSIDTLYSFANDNADLEFYVTKIGCGIAGFEIEEIANIFKSKEFTPFNIILPMEFTLIKGVKGFDKNMKCRGFQFDENKEFVYNEEIKCCESGFHFCENPIDVFKYYKNKDGNIFCEVAGIGNIDISKDDSKISVSKLDIKFRISIEKIRELILDFSFKKTSFIYKRLENKRVKLINKFSTLAAQDYSTLAAQDNSQLAARNFSQLAAQDNSTLAAQDNSQLAARNFSTLAAQDNSQLAARDYSTLAAQDNSQLAARDNSTLAAQDNSQLAARNNNTIELIGKNNIAVASNGSKIKGKMGNAICLVEYDNDNNICGVKSAIIDGIELKEDVYYQLKDGNFIEV